LSSRSRGLALQGAREKAQKLTPAEVFAKIAVAIFRVNERLFEKGNELVAPLGMTSARWQVIAPIALSGQALSCPQIAASMGVSRQGAQKQLNLALEDGLVVTEPNPRHARSLLYQLTEAGRRSHEQAMERQAPWARALVQGLSSADLETTLRVLRELDARLESTALPSHKLKP
jgi:DNA-binding MarR family transcriptional regulator